MKSDAPEEKKVELLYDKFDGTSSYFSLFLSDEGLPKYRFIPVLTVRWLGRMGKHPRRDRSGGHR